MYYASSPFSHRFHFCINMIKGILVINTSGKPHLIRFYEELPERTRSSIIAAVYRECSKRGEKSCNFIENSLIWENYTIIYKQYATLYLIIIADEAENELGILDLIQVFVEVLDKAFVNVCELDFIFHPEKVYQVLEEIVVGGMVLETNIQEIWTCTDSLLKHEKRA